MKYQLSLLLDLFDPFLFLLLPHDRLLLFGLFHLLPAGLRLPPDFLDALFLKLQLHFEDILEAARFIDPINVL